MFCITNLWCLEMSTYNLQNSFTCHFEEESLRVLCKGLSKCIAEHPV